MVGSEVKGRTGGAGWRGAAMALFGFGALVALPPGALARQLWSLAVPSVKSVESGRAGVHQIEFDQAAVEAWPVGESGELRLPGGRTADIRAVRVENHPSGNRTWVGQYERNGRSWVAILTYGPAGVTGEVRAPEGEVLIGTARGETMLVDTAEAGWLLPDIPAEDALVPSRAQLEESARHGPDMLAGGIETGLARTRGPAEKSAPAAQTTIDVLFAYTHALAARQGSTAGALLRLDQLVATANQAYVASEVAITLRLVNAVEVGYTENNANNTALTDLTNGAGVLAAPKTTLRDRYGADIVVLVRPFAYPDQVGCGVAWVGGYGGNGALIGGQSGAGFAVVSDGSDANGSAYFCQSITLAHELGHIMGALHDRATESQGGAIALDTGAYAYSYGYVANATFSNGSNACNATAGSLCFGTVMSYLSKCSEVKFSNPAILSCGGTQACGTANDNVALTLNNTRAGVASWRPTKVPFTGAPTGGGQTALSGQAFAAPLVVTVRDATGALVPGVSVNFAAPESGATAALSATTVVTDANGVARITATANGVTGSYAVTATAASGLVAAPFTFNLANAGTQASALTVVVNGGGTVSGGGISCPGACASAPAVGSTVQLTAAAGSGSAFTGWLGGGCTGTGTCTVAFAQTATVVATFAPASLLPVRLDVDANGRYDALTDGLLILRFLFGMSDAALTGGAIGSGAQRSTPTAIKTWLGSVAPMLDIDGDGRADALTDGVMILRYMFGVRGAGLIQGATGADATRATAALIESYLGTLLP